MTAADMPFGPGLNVISGASNTGKSYMLRCLDFVFGATRFSKEIEEARGYDRIWLEIIDRDGASHCLERRLAGGNIFHYPVPLADIRRAHSEPLRPKADRSKKPDISTFVLSAAGIPLAEVRKKRGQNARLTLRQFDHLFMIDETSIIAERSPVLDEGGFSQRTYSESAFNFFITGKDDAELGSSIDSKVADTARRAKVEMVEQLLASLESRVSSLPKLEQSAADLLEDVQTQLDRLAESIDLRTSEVEAARAERVAAIEERQKADTQIVAIEELLLRFELLDQRYQSDLARLEFVADGSHYFGQLDAAYCPVCGQALTIDHAEHINADEDGLVSQVQEASRAEAAKILNLRLGLEKTVADLRSKHAQEKRRAESALQRREEAERRLTLELRPALESASASFQLAARRQQELTARRMEEQRIAELRGIRADLEPVFSLRAPDETRRLDRQATHALSLTIEGILREWSWPGAGRVEFDPKELDIVVDGKPRQSNGKGVRAILHAAFAIGLMRHAASKGLPHPGFVVLDSPLTTYKQGQAPDAGDEVVQQIEQSFFAALANTPADQQIVILENKTPDPSLTSRFSYVEFTGGTASGRRGFIP